MMTMMGRDGCGVGNDDNCDDFKASTTSFDSPVSNSFFRN